MCCFRIGVKKYSSQAQKTGSCSPKGVVVEISDGHLCLVYMGVPPAACSQSFLSGMERSWHVVLRDSIVVRYTRWTYYRSEWVDDYLIQAQTSYTARYALLSNLRVTWHNIGEDTKSCVTLAWQMFLSVLMISHAYLVVYSGIIPRVMNFFILVSCLFKDLSHGILSCFAHVQKCFKWKKKNCK